MNIHIKSVHFDADGKFISKIEEKVSKLEHFQKKIMDVDVYLKLDNLVHNIKDKVVEIRVLVPRRSFFVKVTCKTFEKSFEQAMSAIVSQMKRQKERLAA